MALGMATGPYAQSDVHQTSAAMHAVLGCTEHEIEELESLVRHCVYNELASTLEQTWSTIEQSNSLWKDVLAGRRHELQLPTDFLQSVGEVKKQIYNTTLAELGTNRASKDDVTVGKAMAAKRRCQDYDEDDEEPDPVKKIKAEGGSLLHAEEPSLPAAFNEVRNPFASAFADRPSPVPFRPAKKIKTPRMMPTLRKAPRLPTMPTANKHIVRNNNINDTPTASFQIMQELKGFMNEQTQDYLDHIMQALESRNEVLIDARVEEERSQWTATAKLELAAQEAELRAWTARLETKEEAQEEWAKHIKESESEEANKLAERKRELTDWEKELSLKEKGLQAWNDEQAREKAALEKKADTEAKIAMRAQRRDKVRYVKPPKAQQVGKR